MISLSYLPTTFLLYNRLSKDKHAEISTKLIAHGCRLTTIADSATLYLGDVQQPRRAQLELRKQGIWTEPEPKHITPRTSKGRPVEVVRLEWFTESILNDIEVERFGFVVFRGHVVPHYVDLKNILHRSGTTDVGSFKAAALEEAADKPSMTKTPLSPSKRNRENPPDVEATDEAKRRKGIMDRALEDASNETNQGHGARRFAQRKPIIENLPPALITQDTQEYEAEKAAEDKLPEPPDWVKEKTVYSCQRATPMHPPSENLSFIEALKTIRLNRTLISDDIGVRAYSTAIAAICAYPHPITSPAEILRLPGCDTKIARLWSEFIHSDPPGTLSILQEIEESEYYKTLEYFWNIWGVGASTAREFYRRSYRDLDDLVMHHWSSLSRVQQIGVKFYEEFLSGIPRHEVESIRDKIQEVARELLPGVEAAVVGGFRRGKDITNDVDLLISHPDVSKSHAVEDLVISLTNELEARGLVTHVLVVHKPGQHVASEDGTIFPKRSHHNFDGIPKVLCVWQDPEPSSPSCSGSSTPTTFHTPPSQSPLNSSPAYIAPPSSPLRSNNLQPSSSPETLTLTVNPNPHRRVDILFPPPRCLGTTLTSWSGATTFERDLRRYVHKTFDWKFTSEGLSDRATGLPIAVDDKPGPFVGVPDGSREVVSDDVNKRERKKDGEWIGWEVEEKKLFKRMGLEWREPCERWTW